MVSFLKIGLVFVRASATSMFLSLCPGIFLQTHCLKPSGGRPFL